MLEKLQSAAPEDTAYFYSASAAEEIERGCIGHLRGNFGRSGEEFWVTWPGALPLKRLLLKKNWVRSFKLSAIRRC